MARALANVLGAMLACASSAAAQTAVPLGPAPATGFGGTTGRVSAVACSRTDANLYFVAGADGGVWKTTDGGATWRALTDDMPTLAIGALALDPVNEAIVYAGSGEANFANHSRYGLGMFKSIDGGEMWVQLGESVFGGRCISKIVIDPVNTQVVFASVTRAGGFPEMAAAKSHPDRMGARGVFRSDDGGATWVQLGGGLPDVDATDLVMDPTNGQVLYAAIGRIFGAPENGIYRTVDGGASWVKLGGGLPTANVGRISIALAPSLPSRLYALVTRPCDATGGGASTLGGYRTSDGGATWTTTALGSIQSTYGWYLSCAAVSPTNPDTVFFGGLNMVRSTNGGTSFSTVTPPHVDIHSIVFDVSGRLLSGNDGGVHRSVNLGTNWSHMNTGLGTIQFYAGLSTHPSDPLVMFGGTQDNGSHRRSTATQNWTSIAGGDGGWTQVDQSDPQRVFVESQGTGVLSRSTNGGNTFVASGSGLTGRNCFLPPYLIDPSNPQRMIYGTERVFQSVNGGVSWTALSADLTGGAPAAIRALAMAPSDSQYVYAATNDGRVLSSSDGGASFELRLTGVPGWPRVTREIAVDPTDARTVYLATAAFGGPRVRRSVDAGAMWEDLTGSLPDVPVNVVGLDVRGPAPVIYAGTDAGLYRSINEGLTWREYGGMPNACVIDLLVEPGRNPPRLIIGTQGRGAWEVPIVLCYADMEDSGVLTANDFVVFLNAFAADRRVANCDLSTGVPMLTANDFACFVNAFAAGCS